MPQLIGQPARIAAAGTKPKVIEEHVGRVNGGEERVSIAHMRSPEAWTEPGQRPAFDEYTIVFAGTLRVEHESGEMFVSAGEAVLASAGEWVRYSTPVSGGADYISVCLPAFSPRAVNRDEA